MKAYKRLCFFPLMVLALFVTSVAYSETDQVDRLIQNLDSEYRELRMCSVWTLGKVHDPRALKALIGALKNKDLGVRVGAAEQLGAMKNPAAIISISIVDALSIRFILRTDPIESPMLLFLPQ